MFNSAKSREYDFDLGPTLQVGVFETGLQQARIFDRCWVESAPCDQQTRRAVVGTAYLAPQSCSQYHHQEQQNSAAVEGLGRERHLPTIEGLTTEY